MSRGVALERTTADSGTSSGVCGHARYLACASAEIFRTAFAVAASAIVLMHNHPLGEPQPSEADITAPRDLIRAG